jgi:hypothetical protein
MAVHSLCDPSKTVWSVVHGIHRGDRGREHFGRADVARGLLSSDVLLTGLERELEGSTAGSISRDADDPSWNGANEIAPRREVARVWPAESEW